MHSATLIESKSLTICATAALVISVQPLQAGTPAIDIVGTNSGKVATAHIKTHDGKTYISGVVYRRINGTGPHLDIALSDKAGKIFASQTTPVTGFQGKPATNQRGTYTASFAPEEVNRAAQVQITFVTGLHAFCDEASKTNLSKS